MLTNYVRKAGFGNNLLTILYTIAYCKLNNLEFQYTPILESEHTNPINLDIFNIYPKSREKCDEKTYQKIMKYMNENIDIFPNLSFYKSLNNNIEPAPQIAIHIRRNNDFDRNLSLGAKMYVNRAINLYPDRFYIKLIDQLMIEYPNHNIHIYSQDLDLNNYKKYNNIVFHLNEPLIDTFNDMLNADILVTGASSLSYCAGLLRKKRTIYLKYYYKPLKHWIIIK